jgi:hypothetical protein
MGQMEPLGPPPNPFEGPTANKMRDRLDLHHNTRNVIGNAAHRVGANLTAAATNPPDPRDARIRGLENDIAQMKADAARMKAALDALSGAAGQGGGDGGWGGTFSGLGNTLSGWGNSITNYLNPPPPPDPHPDVPKMRGVDDGWDSYVWGPRGPIARMQGSMPWWLGGGHDSGGPVIRHPIGPK